MTTKLHYLLCEAPICQGYSTENLLWYPDEKICKLTPYTKWQKTQRKIQKLWKKKQVHPDRYFTVAMLSKMSIVRKGIEGKSPETIQDGL